MVAGEKYKMKIIARIENNPKTAEEMKEAGYTWNEKKGYWYKQVRGKLK